MEYIVSRQNDAVCLCLSGRFTYRDRRDFLAALEQISAADANDIVIDLENTDFIDSSALGMLLLLRENAAPKRRVLLCHAQGQVRQILDITHFEEMFIIED